MTIVQAIIQGIIQGLTEFLPISSSGHLSISKHFFNIEMPSIAFDIMLHLGTLIAVVFVYWETFVKLVLEFFRLIADIFKRRFKWSEMSKDRRLLMMLIIGLVPLFLLFIPIPGTGMNIKDLSEILSTDSSILVEGIALLFTSLLLFLGIRANKKTIKEKRVIDKKGQVVSTNGRIKIHTKDAISIGLAQFLAAIFPGISRSGSTLSVGLMRGINKQTALDYSFVLGTPAIVAAALVSIKDLGADTIGVSTGALIAGVITSAVVGFFAIKVLKWIVSSDKLSVFAYYTLILGGVVVIISIIEHITGTNLFSGAPM